MYENKNQELKKVFEEKGLSSEDLTGRVSFLVDILGIKSSRCNELHRRGNQTCQVDLNNLSDIPKDILSTMYGDLCQLYEELEPTVK